MTEPEARVRKEIAARMLSESLIPMYRVARWTGLSVKQIAEIQKEVGRPKIINEEDYIDYE